MDDMTSTNRVRRRASGSPSGTTLRTWWEVKRTDLKTGAVDYLHEMFWTDRGYRYDRVHAFGTRDRHRRLVDPRRWRIVVVRVTRSPAGTAEQRGYQRALVDVDALCAKYEGTPSFSHTQFVLALHALRGLK